jgi:hypothetical protein
MWWLQHGHISEGTLKRIDFATTEDMMHSLKLPHRLYVTKAASHNYGAGETLVKWNFQTTAKCPRCEEVQETPDHIQQCNGHGADVVFESSLLKLQSYLIDKETRPLIAGCSPLLHTQVAQSTPHPRHTILPGRPGCNISSS